MSLTYNSEPRVVFITQLLNQIREGLIKVPRFQRELVWDWDQQRDLLCSIYEGLPIGAILMWHTTLNDIKSYERIGPFQLKKQNENSFNIFLMDGLQRLSTLYCMLLHPDDDTEVGDELSDYEVYCDLDSDDIDSLFLQKKTVDKLGMNIKKGSYMPLKCALDTRSLLRFQREIPDEREDWIDKSEAVASAFKNYKIPVVPLESNQQEIVTKSFERINTRGTIMSEAHMLNALSYSSEFDLLNEIELCREKYLKDFDDWYLIDTDYILMVIKMHVGVDIYDKNTEKLAKKISKDNLSYVFEGLLKLVTFSKDYLNISSPSNFPYKIQVPALAFSLNNLDKLNYENLYSWYIITTYTGAFGVTARNSSNTLQDLKNFIETGTFKWSLNFKPQVSCRSKNTNYKSSRVKAWASALGKKIDSASIYKENIQEAIINEKGKNIQRPNDIELSEIPLQLKMKPGFYFINYKKTKKQNFNINDIPENEWDANFIKDYLIDYFNNHQYEDFACERERLIYNWEIENIVKPAAQNLRITNISYDK